MKLYENLPDSVMVSGKRIRVDLDFRNVLKMIDIMARDELIPAAREWLALKCICKHPKPGMLKAVIDLLFSGEKPNGEKITDFSQDADLIRAAFLQAYGINLFRDKLHWFEFCCLLSCIPEGNKYSEVLSVRARPIPAATKYNAKEREWLMRAKAEYRLKLSEEEMQEKYESDVSNIFKGLMKMIPSEGSENNNGE